jgi:phosphatidate phosphatase APP1
MSARGFSLGALTLLTLALARASDLRRDETMVFFPTAARFDPERREWETELHGWVFEREDRTVSVALLRETLGLGGLEWDEESRHIFQERARWFLVDNERDKRVTVTVAGQEFTLPRSDANGHVAARVRWQDPRPEYGGSNRTEVRVLPLTVAGGASGATVIDGAVHRLSPTGVSVISDIDDTIRISEVRDREALLRNTFLKPFRPVTGMAEIYAAWATNHGASFHYVTACPWQLYPELTAFLQTNGFPHGPFHMKLFRWKDRSFWGLFQSPERYKRKVIEPLLRQFPQRQFVLVGDSGERDPEIYGELARRFPREVQRILIRDVTGESLEVERYRRAFADLPAGRAVVFREPGEVRDTITLPR